MTKGTRLFDPPTAADCVEARAWVARARDELTRGMPTVWRLELAAQLGLVGDLLAAIAGQRPVSVAERVEDAEA